MPEKKVRKEQNIPTPNETMAATVARLEAENLDLRRRLSDSQFAQTPAGLDSADHEQRFRSMVENSPDAAYQRNLLTDRYDYLSPIIEQVLGWPVEDMLNADIQTVLARMHPDDLANVERVIQETDEDCRRLGHASGLLEYRFLDNEGCYRWINDQITVLPDAEGRPLYRLGFVRDVSVQKQFQQALINSESNYMALFETMPQGVVYQDREGKIISANPAAQRMLGMTLDQMRGLTSLDPRWRAIHEDGSDFPGEDHPIRVALRTAAPVTGVTMGVYNPQTDSYHWLLVSATPQNRPGEEKPYQAYATFEDITARKLMEDALQKSENKFRDLFNKHAAVKLLIDPVDGKIIDANAAAADFYGWSVEQLRRMKVQQINTLSSEQVEAELRNAREQRRIHFEFIHRLADGSLRNVEVYSSQIEVQGKTLLHSIIHDITARKQAEDALRKSEERYRSLFEGITEGFAVHEIVCDENGQPCDYQFLDINPSFERLTGLERKNVIGKYMRQVLPDDDPDWIRIFGEVALTGRPVRFENYSIALKRHYDVFAFSPAPRQFATLFFETTERKQAEAERERLMKALEIERGRWQSTVETMPIMVLVCDLHGQITYLNPAGRDMLQRIGLALVDVQHPEIPAMYRLDGAQLQAHELPFNQAAARNQTIQNEAVMLHSRTGEPVYLLWNAAPLHDSNGQLVGAIGVGRDISELKDIEQKLRATNQRLNTILSSMTDIFYVLDSDWRFVELNTEAQEKFFQRPAGELLGKVLWECYPQSLNTIIEKNYRQAVAGNQPVHFDVHSVIRDAWYEAHAYPRDGLLEIYLRDITERKVAEDEIKKLAGFPEQNPNPILRVASDGKLIYANRASQMLCNEMGLQLGRPIPEDWQELVRNVLAHKKNHLIDTRFRNIIYSLTFVPFPESGYVNIYGQDVTERVNNARALQKAHDELELRVQSRTEELLIANKRLQVEAATRLKAEETLRLANAYNRSLIETNLDPMMTISLDGMVSDVNAAAELITGYRRDEVIGTDFYRYFTDPLRAVKAYREVLIQGSIRDFELEFRHRDGTVRQVDYNAAVYRDTNGKIIGILAAARDISLRKQAEQQILIQTTALEAAANGVMITDVSGAILWANPAFSQITGYDISETSGQNPRLIKSGQTHPETYENLWQTILAGKVWHGELTNRRKDGSLYIEEETITPVLDGNGSVSHFIAVIQDVTERRRSEIELVRLNRAEKLLSECNSLLIHAEEEEGLLTDICRLIVEVGGYRLAWIGFPEQDPGKHIRPVAMFGEPAEYVTSAQISWGDNERGHGPMGTAQREGKVQINQDFKTNAHMDLWRELALKSGFQSSAALPLQEKQQTFGVLAIYSAIPDAFNPEEAALLAKLAENLSFGISTMRERIERERAQDAARRWAHIFEHAEWGVVIGSADGQTLELMNPAFARMHGRTVEELIGKPIRDVFAPDSQAALTQHIQMAHDLGHHVFEANHIRQDGSIFPVFVDVTTVKDDAGQILYRAVNIQDITERKAAERNIQQQEALLRTMMDNLPVGVWLTDENGKIVRANPAGMKIWSEVRCVGPGGFGEAKGWRVDSGDEIKPEDWAAARAMSRNEPTVNEELEIECLDGTRKFIFNSAFPLYDDQHRFNSAVIVNQDITDIRRAQNELIRANELLERAFASVDVMIASLDRDFNFLKVNRAFAQMENQLPEVFIGMNYFELYPSAEIQSHFEEVIATGESCSLFRQPYFNPLHPERGKIYWDYSMQPVKDPAGQVVGVVLSLADVTERMQAEIALLESVEKYRSLVESSPDAILLTNLDHKILFASQHALEFFGASDVKDLLGQNVVDFFAPEDRQRAENNARSTLSRGVTRNIEYTFLKLNGARFPVELNMTVVRNAQGQPVAFHKVGRDITERKRAEQALKVERQHLITLSQAERNQRLFAESLAQATVALTSSLDLNEVLDRILDQIEPVVPFDAAIVSLSEEDAIRIARSRGFEDRPQIIENIQSQISLEDFPPLKEILKSGKPMVITGSDEGASFATLPEWNWVQSYIGIPLQTREHVIGTLNMLFDHPRVVEQEQIDRLTTFAYQASIAIHNARLYKELENSLAQEHALRTRLIQSEKFAAMGRLLGSVAHELNNPLQTIKNCLFLSREDTPTDSPVQEYLDMAFSETARLSKLVGQLRELYRPRTENSTKAYTYFEIVEEVHNLLKAHLAQQKVTWLRIPGCEEARVKCNLDQIKQVLINIGMNGIEAMQPNGGTLEVGLTVADETHMVGVYFRDSGPGIAPEILQNLFEPFVTTKSSGLGLGLSICYELIQRHNGQITVDTQINQGTTFTIWLPLLQETQTP